MAKFFGKNPHKKYVRQFSNSIVKHIIQPKVDKIETIESTNATIISKEEVEVPVIENISVDTYMSELFPQNLNSNQFDPKVKCYKYNLVTILETGANFGDIALQNSVQKRTATVILLEDCHFGALSKSIYEMC